MKNTPSSTHLSDLPVYKAHQNESPSPTKADIQEAFVAIAQTVEEILQDLFIHDLEQ
ncbi:MAG: hypothetical protein AAF921_06315 [Cyanobacteria bacterium P01_D01_bin.44]